MSRPPASRSQYLLPVLFAGLFAWVFFLRAPSFGATLWNVDESIHAAVARTLRDGGTLYRDAIDQRTPLTYWLFAGAFSVFGDNNLVAVRALLAGLIAGAAFALFLVGRRTRDTATGLWSAAIFVALSANLLSPADAFAAHTEWAVAACTTAGAWWFWRSAAAPSLRSGLVGGGLFGLAFLSKQPALLDFAAPLVTAGWLVASGSWSRREGVRMLGGLLAGFTGLVGAVAARFAMAGALDDAVFYTWTYNLRYYGPEISWLDRAASGLQPFLLLAHAYPAVLSAGLVAAVLLIGHLVQLRPSPGQKAANGWHCYLLVWSAASLAGAASSGRGFEHYTIQCLPPFALAAALVLAKAATWAGRLWAAPGVGQRLGSVCLSALVLASGLTVLWHPLAARRAAHPPKDPALEAAAYIRERTAETDPIFVWGYNPDIYLYADRPAASRFVYCSFLTGLIPWTNLDPQKDTAYAIVPGAMDTLLRELIERRPPFIVDCSPGPHRNFHKYPIVNFPELQALLDRDYVVVDAGRFVPQGFRLHLLRDRARTAPLPLAGGPTGSGTTNPRLFGRGEAEAVPTPYTVTCQDDSGRLQRLELLVDDQVVDGVSVAPSRGLTVTLVAPFDTIGTGQHRLAARATRADGTVTLGAETSVNCSADTLPADKLATFQIPVVERVIAPSGVRAPFGPSAQREGDTLVFAVHAPSSMVVPLPPKARRVSGGFGLRPGAFADKNAGTDGARFRILLHDTDGTTSVLLERLLRPGDVEADRLLQRFSLDLTRNTGARQLELTTDPGPADNAAYDWTIWTDLAIDSTE